MKREALHKCTAEGEFIGQKSWLKLIGGALFAFGVMLMVAAQVSQALEALELIGTSFSGFENGLKSIGVGALFYSGEVLGLADRFQEIVGG